MCANYHKSLIRMITLQNFTDFCNEKVESMGCWQKGAGRWLFWNSSTVAGTRVEQQNQVHAGGRARSWPHVPGPRERRARVRLPAAADEPQDRALTTAQAERQRRRDEALPVGYRTPHGRTTWTAAWHTPASRMHRTDKVQSTIKIVCGTFIWCTLYECITIIVVQLRQLIMYILLNIKFNIVHIRV